MKQRIYTFLAWLGLAVALFAQQPQNVLGTNTSGQLNRSFTLGSGKTITAASGSSLTLSSGSTLGFFGSSVTDASTFRTAAGLGIGSAVQAYDADLTTLASSTAFFLSLADDADASTARTTLGLAIGTDVQAYDADLANIAALSTTAFGRGLLDDADAAAGRTSLGASAGIWPPSLGGTGLDTSATVADRFLYTSGTGTWAAGGVTTFARSILDDADAAAVRATAKVKDRRTILVVGNSISTTVSPATTNWVSLLSAMAEFQDDVIVNNAVGGEELNQTLSNYATRVTPYIPATTGRPLIVFLPCAAGVDVYNGTSAATAWGRIQTFVDQVQADGGKVVIGTVAPGSAFGGASETRRTDLNALIVAGRSDYDWYWPMHILYPDQTGAFFTTDDQHTSNFGAAVMARDALNAWRGLYDYSTMLPPTMVMANGLTLRLADDSTAGVTISATGGATFADELQVAGITGGFASGGLWLDASVCRMGVLSSTMFIRIPSGGLEWYSSATAQLAQLNDAGRLGVPSLRVGGTIGGSGTEIKGIKHTTAVLVAGTVTVSDSTTTANSRIFVNRFTDGGTLGDSYSVTRSAGASYTITSKTANATQTGDTSTVAILKIEP